jgi:hypothetical protein
MQSRPIDMLTKSRILTKILVDMIDLVDMISMFKFVSSCEISSDEPSTTEMLFSIDFLPPVCSLSLVLYITFGVHANKGATHVKRLILHY